MRSKRARLSLTTSCALALLPPSAVVVANADPPPRENCLDAPCRYAGECRAPRGAGCGGTVAYCNAESVWVPACGGGAGLVRPARAPSTASQPIPPPPPPSPHLLPPPTHRPATTGVRWSVAPTTSPTTAWEGWISNKEKDALAAGAADGNGRGGGEGGDRAQGGSGQAAAGNADDLEGFDAEAWGYRGEKDEEESLFDRLNPFGEDSSEDSSAAPTGTELALLASAVTFAWGALS